MFINPKLLMSPMKGEPVLEKASVKPQKVHWNEMTAITESDWKIMASADLRRAIPP